MQRFLRYKTDFSLILFDIDHFKHVNDQYGHATGDRCLIEIISRVKPIIRETDFLARYGGEEFIVLLPETNGKNAQIAAEKLRTVIENIEFLHKGDLVKITISAGVSQAKPEDQDYETLFGRTDQALYQAKNSGRNQVSLL
jgi:diguanylate cyclase